MNDIVIKRPAVHQPAIYGHPEDEAFETECPDHAKAYAKVYPHISELRRRLQTGGRFSNDSRIEGALARHVQLLVEWERGKIQNATQEAAQRHDSPPALVPTSTISTRHRVSENSTSIDGYVGTQSKVSSISQEDPLATVGT